jgi:hypothetical protein
MKFYDLVQTALQILIFSTFYTYVLYYTQHRKGIEESAHIIKGARYYRDDNGVNII